MNESVVEGGKEVHNSEVVHILLVSDLRWTEVGLLILLHFNFLLWWLHNARLEFLECSTYHLSLLFNNE